tara:strand:- start:2999 stop:3601 length:603 start_codon:yes stop_codon:yes gene_type:complete
MSIECLNQALKIKGLTPTKKFILVLLGNYADENGSCYPSYRHIADIVGLKDTKGVQKAIKEFESLGLLRIEHRKNKKGGHTSNRYHLSIAMGAETLRVDVTQRQGVSEPSNTKEDTKDNILFEKFWSVYPRKIAKKKAKEIFEKHKDQERIVEGAIKFASLNEMTDEKFIPHPTTWLNGERWNDEMKQPARRTNLNSLAG